MIQEEKDVSYQLETLKGIQDELLDIHSRMENVFLKNIPKPRKDVKGWMNSLLAMATDSHSLVGHVTSLDKIYSNIAEGK